MWSLLSFVGLESRAVRNWRAKASSVIAAMVDVEYGYCFELRG
jgi:hypothetical protein